MAFKLNHTYQYTYSPEGKNKKEFTYSFTCEHLGEACQESHVWLLVKPKVEETDLPLFHRELQPKEIIEGTKENIEAVVKELVGEYFVKEEQH